MTATCRRPTLELEFSDSIHRVKSMLEDMFNIPVGQQRLIFSGRLLVDTLSLADYRIERESTLHLVPRLHD